MYAYASVLFALYSLSDIPVCFLKYRPKKNWSGKRYLSAISFSISCRRLGTDQLRHLYQIPAPGGHHNRWTL